MVPEREPEKRLPHLRKAAGAQITQSQNGEVVTKSINRGVIGSSSWNEYRVNNLTRTNRRASQVPAAAVILTPRVFVHSAAVKKFVVGPMNGTTL